MDLQYPIGKFAWNRTGEGLLASEAERQQWLADIEETPARLRAAVRGLRKRSLTRLTGPVAGPSARWCITSPTAT